MKLAVNCSYQAMDLLRKKKVHFDYLKCPAWPDVVALARETHPTYVHFPLAAGSGLGDALNAETGQPADWHAMESLLAETNTPLVNLHLAANADDRPDPAASSVNPAIVDAVVKNITRDVRAVVERFGAEKVIVENIGESGNRFLRPTYLPEVISAVIEETGCGLLLDLSQAQLAAYTLGMDAREYIGLLPVKRIREIHITTYSEVLTDQVPRLYAIVKGDQSGGSGCRRPETGAFSPGDG